MVAPVRRRISASNAIARGPDPEPEAPPKVAVVRGRGKIGTTMSDKHSTFYEDHRAEDNVLEHRFTTDNPPATVHLSAGLTRSLGNFEFFRSDCSISIPCDRTQIEKAYETASAYVADKLNRELETWGLNDPPKNRGKAG